MKTTNNYTITKVQRGIFTVLLVTTQVAIMRLHK